MNAPMLRYMAFVMHTEIIMLSFEQTVNGKMYWINEWAERVMDSR